MGTVEGLTNVVAIQIADCIWRETNGVISYDNASKLAVRLVNGPLSTSAVIKLLIREAESRGRKV